MSFASETARKSPSEIFEITDELAAYMLNATVAKVRLKFENKRDLARSEMFKNDLRQIISEVLTGESQDTPAPAKMETAGDINGGKPRLW